MVAFQANNVAEVTASESREVDVCVPLSDQVERRRREVQFYATQDESNRNVPINWVLHAFDHGGGWGVRGSTFRPEGNVVLRLPLDS